MDYLNAKYSELKTECARLGLGGGGKRDDLINKLVAHERGMEQPEVTADKPLPKVKNPKIKPTDPNPENHNFDMAGRWRRRLKGWLGWDDDGKAIMKG